MPISDEMLAAYLQGSLPEDQVQLVETAIENNEDYQAIIDEYLSMSDFFLTDEKKNYSDNTVSIYSPPDLTVPKKKHAGVKRWIAAASLLLAFSSLGIYILRSNHLNNNENQYAYNASNNKSNSLNNPLTQHNNGDYELQKTNSNLNNTSITDKSSTSNSDSLPLSMIFPKSKYTIHDMQSELTIQWSQITETAYIHITADNKEWIDISVHNTNHITIEPVDFKDYNYLDWIIKIGNNEFGGTIIIPKKNQ